MGASWLNPAGTEIGGEDLTIAENELPRHEHYYGIKGTPNITVAETEGWIDTDGAGVRYNSGTTTKAAKTFDFGPNTPTDQVDIVNTRLLPPTVPIYVYIKT
jgi:hypothetical protein